MPMPPASRLLARICLPAALVLAAACDAPRRSWEEGAQTPATPQRPTYSYNTSTTAPGTFEVETGAYRDPGDSFSWPLTLKYGVLETAEAFVRTAPLEGVEGAGATGIGFGDVWLAWRQRFAEQGDRHPSAAWQASVKLPTADESEGLGTGELDVFGALIGTLQEPGWSGTGFAQLGLLGDPAGSDVQPQGAVALAVDGAVGGGAGLFGELTGVFTPDRDLEEVYTILGGTWAPAPGLVLDASVLIGLSSDAPDFALQVGFTRNLGRAIGWALRRDGS